MSQRVILRTDITANMYRSRCYCYGPRRLVPVHAVWRSFAASWLACALIAGSFSRPSAVDSQDNTAARSLAGSAGHTWSKISSLQADGCVWHQACMTCDVVMMKHIRESGPAKWWRFSARQGATKAAEAAAVLMPRSQRQCRPAQNGTHLSVKHCSLSCDTLPSSPSRSAVCSSAGTPACSGDSTAPCCGVCPATRAA